MSSGLCWQHEQKLREEQRTSLMTYMRENAEDESLSPELREQCREWLRSAESRGDSGQ